MPSPTVVGPDPGRSPSDERPATGRPAARHRAFPCGLSDACGTDQPLAPAHDAHQVVRGVEHHQVGVLAGRERADPVVDAEQPGGVGGERLDGLVDRQAVHGDGAFEGAVQGECGARDGARRGAFADPRDAVPDLDPHRAERVASRRSCRPRPWRR